MTRTLSSVVLLWSLALSAVAAPPPRPALPDFATLVEANGPAVVNISTTQTVKQGAMPPGMPELPEGSPFNDFFRRYFGEGGAMPEQFDSKSLGSGFITSQDGYILTAAHVVENAKEIFVKLTDRREYVAKVVGADRRSDVALLKIEATGLPKVNIGDPTKLKVGEWVLAIGSPFGFENSATSGIVSAKGRSLPSESYVPFIQTDVAINPGNSGGPLFNLNGEVVGINSQIYSRTGGFMGLSFAVPIDMAMQIGKQLRAEGKVKRGWIGVTIQDITRELAQSFGMQKPHGALISDILPSGPAAKSELKVGDVVVEYDGQPIDLSSDLPPRVGLTAPGTRVRLAVVRGGKTQQVWVTIGELPEEKSMAQQQDDAPAKSQNKSVAGLGVNDLTPVQKKQLGINYGVIVNELRNGPAARAGLRPGDVILEIGGKTVKNVAVFEQLVKHAPKNRPLPLLVKRGAGSLFLALPLGE